MRIDKTVTDRFHLYAYHEDGDMWVRCIHKDDRTPSHLHSGGFGFRLLPKGCIPDGIGYISPDNMYYRDFTTCSALYAGPEESIPDFLKTLALAYKGDEDFGDAALTIMCHENRAFPVRRIAEAWQGNGPDTLDRHKSLLKAVLERRYRVDNPELFTHALMGALNPEADKIDAIKQAAVNLAFKCGYLIVPDATGRHNTHLFREDMLSGLKPADGGLSTLWSYGPAHAERVEWTRRVILTSL